jgi:hypothetical protein
MITLFVVSMIGTARVHEVVGIDELGLDQWKASAFEKGQIVGCTFKNDTDFGSNSSTDFQHPGKVASAQECCSLCARDSSCAGATFCNKGTGCDNECWVKKTKDVQTSYHRKGRVACTKLPPTPSNSTNAKFTIPATVPGDLLTDLENAKLIGDPLFEFNFKNATLWANYTWEYSTVIDLGHPFLASILDRTAATDDAVLVFEGVKMGATVMLDGNPLGKVTNQFLRYNYSIGSALRNSSSGSAKLTVTFDGTATGGRFMACTGGWDWGPYSNTYAGRDHTFSYGLWQRVYLIKTPAKGAVITHTTPYTFYQGGHEVVPMEDGKHKGFSVSVVTSLHAGSGGAEGTLIATGAWGATTSAKVTIPAGKTVATTLNLSASASKINLWWPANTGRAQPLYNVTITFTQTGSRAVAATRRIGFRTAALVTGNDTDPAYVAKAASEEGADAHGMYYRINGAAVLMRGGNMIPMDNMEGRYQDGAHVMLVQSAAEANMNMLRVRSI